ncbi:MAG: pilus assembly protein PilM [Candidatus Doudnabacteria bacterium]|nr:pilus assembly protein PilM [Candidatus Doudnabacteria bacterium]
MSLFGKFKRSGPVNGSYLALDIGTEVVKALVFEVDEETGEGVVIGSGRAAQPLGAMHAGAVGDIAAVVQVCERAIFEASERAGVRPTQVVLGMAGELVKGMTTTVSYERLKPEQKIDAAELKNIVHKVQWRALERVKQQLVRETGQQGIDVRLITGSVVDVRIDGYRVTQPVGFQGKDVALSIFNAYAPLVHIGALESIAEQLDLDLLSVTAEPYAVATSVGVGEQLEFSAIFIDVGGGTTDVAVVRGGVIEGTKMFGIGGRAFTRRVSQALDLPFEEAEETKIKYSENMLPSSSAERVRREVDGDLSVWREGVALALEEFSKTEPLPSRVLLCGGGSKLPGMKEVLMDPDFVERLPFSRPPNIHFMSPQDVVLMSDSTGLLVGQEDVTPLGLASQAIREVLLPSDEFSSVVRRAVRLLQTA